MSALLQDLRYAIRVLSKKPGLTFIILITLALGIGANTAIFSVINGVLLQPLPYRNPGDLVLIQYVERGKGTSIERASYQDFQDWKPQNQIFEDVATFSPWRELFVTNNGMEQVPAARISANFFRLLGIDVSRGRTFLAEEETSGSEKVVIVSHAFWQRVFGTDERLNGQRIRLSGQSVTVVGILPPEFKFPFYLEKAEIWTTNAIIKPEMIVDRGVRNLRLIARLRSGLSLHTAQDELTRISGHIERVNSATNRDRDILLTRIHDELTKEVRSTLWLLFGAVGFVLLIACSNVANLLLARAISRYKEIAIRVALGASTWRIVRQSLIESLLLSVMGGVLGLILAAWGIPLLLELSPQSLPRINRVNISSQVFYFAFALSILTTAFFGLAPAFKAARTNVSGALKDSGQTSAPRSGRNWLRTSLVIGEIAVAFILLIGAGLLISSYIRLNRVSLGFKTENVLTAGLSFPPDKYPDGEQRVAFFEQALERIKSLPGVLSVGFASSSPFSSISVTSSFGILGEASPTNEVLMAEILTATPDYFTTMGMQFLNGRPFTEADGKRNKGVVIINEAFVRRFFPNKNPLGQTITLYSNRDKDSPSEFETIGIIGNIRGVTLDKEPAPEIYTPYRQMSWPFGQLVVRTETDPLSLVNAMRQQIKNLDGEIMISNPNSIKNLIAESLASQRLNLILLSIFAGIGLILTMVGIFGVMSYFVNETRHQIGIRIAVGAQTSDVFKFVLGKGISMILLGITIGVAGALGLTGLMTSLLYGVTATDPVTFIAVVILLILVSLLACYIPAHRATKADPAVILRSE